MAWSLSKGMSPVTCRYCVDIVDIVDISIYGTDHVVEEDAEAPHCQLGPVVALLDDPLGRRVHVGACNSQL